MTQYECRNVPQVTNKVAELTGTLPNREAWKSYCAALKASGNASDTVEYEDGDGNDVSIFIGYDRNSRTWLVGLA